MKIAKFVDAHLHLCNYKKKVKKEEIKNFLLIPTGYNHECNVKTKKIAEELKTPFVLGIAPQTVLFEGFKEEWVNFIKNSNPNAIGEIGLDWHWAKNEEERKKEIKIFYKMLELAEEMKKNIVIHSRESNKEILEILPSFNNKFMMHFFSGDLKEANKVIDMGGLISIPPLRSKKRKKIIKETSLEFLITETDSPYVGKDFKEIIDVVEYISEIKNIEKNIIKEQICKNAVSFFNIKE